MGTDDWKRSETAYVSEYVDEVCNEIARKVIWHCQRLKSDAFGDDTVLGNVWDQICVQVQDQESVFWSAYLYDLDGMIGVQLSQRSEALRRLIWFQTDRGMMEEEDDSYDQNDVIDHILHSYVLSQAADYSNRRIERYLCPPEDDWS